MTAMVDVSNLTKRFGTFIAVNDISFQVNKGEVLGFLGPNGAGKSTTMKMITGFLTPDNGTVTVGGKEISQSPIEVKKLIGYLPEGAPLYSDMNPISFLEFIAEIRGLRGSDVKSRIDEVVAKVNLESVVHKPIETLSKGFKRRVGLAQAILHDPQVLVLDEPTDGLDPNQKHEVRSLITEMSSDKVIILSTHILEEVDAVCSRAMIIANGKVVADGTPESLEAKSPIHNTVALTIKGASPSDVSDKLGKIDGVKSVETLGDTESKTTFRIYPKDGNSLTEKVSLAARDNNWDIENLHIEKGRLDEVFRSITTEQQAIS